MKYTIKLPARKLSTPVQHTPHVPAKPNMVNGDADQPCVKTVTASINPDSAFLDCTNKTPSQTIYEFQPSATPVQLSLPETGHCFWSEGDMKCLVDMLVQYKAQAGDGSNFQNKTFQKAVTELEKIRKKGGPKTVKACCDKWQSVWCISYAIYNLRSKVSICRSDRHSMSSKTSRASQGGPGATSMVLVLC
jgi:hypothetical protein